MKTSVILAAALAVALVAFGANANQTAGTSIGTATPQPVPAMAWRCGKKNPAMWGTFGNGCLKQKRKAK